MGREYMLYVKEKDTDLIIGPAKEGMIKRWYEFFQWSEFAYIFSEETFYQEYEWAHLEDLMERDVFLPLQISIYHRDEGFTFRKIIDIDPKRTLRIDAYNQEHELFKQMLRKERVEEEHRRKVENWKKQDEEYARMSDQEKEKVQKEMFDTFGTEEDSRP